jgi:hypothetical protein
LEERKAKFQKAIVEGRVTAEQVETEGRNASYMPPVTEDGPFIQLASDFPEAVVVESFKEVEGAIREISTLLDLPTNLRSSTAVLQELLNREYISSSVFELFKSVREARNAAVHAGRPNRTSPGEGLEYPEQAKLLNEHLGRHYSNYIIADPHGLADRR